MFFYIYELKIFNRAHIQLKCVNALCSQLSFHSCNYSNNNSTVTVKVTKAIALTASASMQWWPFPFRYWIVQRKRMHSFMRWMKIHSFNLIRIRMWNANHQNWKKNGKKGKRLKVVRAKAEARIRKREREKRKLWTRKTTKLTTKAAQKATIHITTATARSIINAISFIILSLRICLVWLLFHSFSMSVFAFVITIFQTHSFDIIRLLCIYFLLLFFSSFFALIFRHKIMCAH